jgi:Fe-S oxidoreductase/nitrate reductase gamma subunit
METVMKDFYIFMWIATATTAAVFLYGIYLKWRLIRLGRKEDRPGMWGARIKSLLSFGLIQRGTLREAFPGVFHSFIFWGFVVLAIGTSVVAIQEDLFVRVLIDELYLYGALALDVMGVVAIFGVLLALFRRYVSRPKRLDNRRDDAIVLVALLLILLTGYFVQGLRVAHNDLNPDEAIPGPLCRTTSERVGENLTGCHDPLYSPVGHAFGGFFLAMGISEDAAYNLWFGLWWLHLALAFATIAYIPYSKLFHMITSPLNAFWKNTRPYGEIPLIDVETAETFGVSKIEEFTQKQLLDLYACTRCGRCQDACPASTTEKPLSPKKVLQDLRAHLDEVGPKLVGIEAEKRADVERSPIPGEVIQDDEIWGCTTCRACHEVCPVLEEVLDKIVDMRRNLVLMESRFPQELMQFFQNMERNFNPWPIGWDTRADWAEGLNLKTMADSPAKTLLWIGCMASFDDRNKKVAIAIAKVLKSAGIEFSILGTEEKCCGETLRRIGNEYQAQMQMKENVEIFKKHGVKRIITPCPHCFNTFKNEYPQFDGEYEVWHHTEFIAKLVRDGRIKLKRTLDEPLAYHDSCYLGRHNDIYDQPRSIVKGVSKRGASEFGRAKNSSFCCGAGGGRMWLEETIGTRINEERTQEALDLSLSLVATACPYCLTMFEDGLKAKDAVERVGVKDVAELVSENLGL